MQSHSYAFQAQELDSETGMGAFQLRLWDERFGRWLSLDPYGQHSSPYLGMGNNPVSNIDPDGGYDGIFSAFFAWVGVGFKGDIVRNPAKKNNTDISKSYGIKLKDGKIGETVMSYEKNGMGHFNEVVIPVIKYGNRDGATHWWDFDFARGFFKDKYSVSNSFRGYWSIWWGSKF